MPLFLLSAADTLLVRQVPPVRTGFEQAVFVAAGVAQILTLVMVVLLAMIFYRMWKAQQAMQEQLARLSSKVDPMIASATAAAENVRALTDAVKHDAVKAAEALGDATTRVRDSVAGIADRIDDFGDLIGRVHQKADDLVDAAESAVNAVKWGARFLNPRRRRKRRGDDKPKRRPQPRGWTPQPPLLDDPPDAGDEDYDGGEILVSPDPDLDEPLDDRPPRRGRGPRAPR